MRILDLHVTAVFVSLGIALDCWGCYRSLRVIRTRRGLTTVPLVTLLFFYMLPLLISGRPVLTNDAANDVFIAIGFHIFARFVIPELYNRHRKRVEAAQH